MHFTFESAHYQNLKIKEKRKHEFFDINKTQIITGGTGGMGLIIAKWMLDKGAKDVILLARQAPSNGVIQTINELNKDKTSVHVKVIDITDPLALRDTFIDKSIGLIIHAAGVIASARIQDQNWLYYEKTFLSKIKGTWSIHQWLGQKSFDKLILFSSMSALVGGNLGEASYASANCFLDSYSNYANRENKIISVNWPGISDVGMALKNKNGIANIEGTIKSLNSKQIVACIEFLLEHDISGQLAVAEIDWEMINVFINKGTGLNGGRKIGPWRPFAELVI